MAPHKPDTLECARLYHELGLSVFPLVRGTKFPAKNFSWTQYRDDRPPTDSELRKWFASGRRDIAVIAGDISGGVVIRDFDEVSSYKAWSAVHPEFAKLLPTVRTKRGFHVYANGDPAQVREHSKSKTGSFGFSDGEFRYNTYCVAPPSRHEDGDFVYFWENLPGDFIPEVNLVEAGFFIDWQTGEDFTQKRRDTGTQQHNGHVLLCKVVGALDERIEAAIRRTIPPHIGMREKLILEFCRELQSFPEFSKDEIPENAEEIIRRWYALAEPTIGTKEFAATLAAFLRVWPRVRVPKDQTAVVATFQRASAADDSWIPEVFDHPSLRILVAMCRELQAMRGDRPFFLSCHSVAPLFGVTHTTAWSWLETLVQLKALEKVKSGSMKARKANEYRFLL